MYIVLKFISLNIFVEFFKTKFKHSNINVRLKKFKFFQIMYLNLDTDIKNITQI